MNKRWGFIIDGRIKEDVCGRGTNLRSVDFHHVLVIKLEPFVVCWILAVGCVVPSVHGAIVVGDGEQLETGVAWLIALNHRIHIQLIWIKIDHS